MNLMPRLEKPWRMLSHMFSRRANDLPLAGTVLTETTLSSLSIGGLQRAYKPTSLYSSPCRHRDYFRVADLNEAARAADASREANGAIYGERLK
jgi:hypothetical protein